MLKLGKDYRRVELPGGFVLSAAAPQRLLWAIVGLGYRRIFHGFRDIPTGYRLGKR